MAGVKPGMATRKGIPNKKSVEIAEKLAALGCDPIEGMARIAAQAELEGDKQLAGKMYSELAQYVAPKRKAVEHSGSMNVSLESMLIQMDEQGIS